MNVRQMFKALLLERSNFSGEERPVHHVTAPVQGHNRFGGQAVPTRKHRWIGGMSDYWASLRLHPQPNLPLSLTQEFSRARAKRVPHG
ncbi:hypothetical protein FHS85_004796 [Rhodoligotrophos appendicifer]